MSAPSGSPAKSPLEVAQKIVSELNGLSPELQTLALKFAIETLGLRPPVASSPTSLLSTPSPSSTVPHAPNADHSTDIRSFTAMKGPQSDQQFAAVVAYFYQFEAKPEERKEAIDADVMKESARLAGRAQVQRWNMTLTNAKNAGYLDPAGNGKYKLSSVGENLVAITLPGDGQSGRTQINGAKKRKKPNRASANKRTKKSKRRLTSS